MELTAAIELLKALKRPVQVAIHTDSQYVIKGMTEWIQGWRRRGWLTSQKKPVASASRRDKGWFGRQGW